VIAVILLVAVLPATEARRSGLALKKFTNRIRAKLQFRTKTRQDAEPAEPIPRELPDIRHNHHHMLDEFLDAFKNHHMSFGEIKLVFQTADRNHDNKVSFQEWDDFYTLFVQPFEEADQRGVYLLEMGDLEPMLTAEETLFDGIHIDPKDYEELLEYFDRFNNGNQLNFADYMFFRKANLAWKECASENGIGFHAMSCAL